LKDEAQIPRVLEGGGASLLFCFHSVQKPQESPDFLPALEALGSENPELRVLYSFRDPIFNDFEYDEFYVYKNKSLVHHEEIKNLTPLAQKLRKVLQIQTLKTAP
jgi:hypothetical protein